MEINKSTTDSLNSLNWKDFSIQLERGKYITFAIVSDSPIISKEMKIRFANLITEIETIHEKDLVDFLGNIQPFEVLHEQIDKILKAHHQFDCRLDLQVLQQVSIPWNIKLFFQTRAYTTEKFKVMDSIQTIIEEKLILDEGEVYSIIKYLLDQEVLIPIAQN